MKKKCLRQKIMFLNYRNNIFIHMFSHIFSSLEEILKILNSL